ncbi:MAG: DUF559 domain-containing protein [Solirubrobacterales bacterium]|nr:DUF559 domain-containing protein [Solirubrobacterales bacterium]MCB8915282.1 type IV toxin-antitoxin system AbiEi family antitoxin domain-containing protein [Thermoleophilales bacterium]
MIHLEVTNLISLLAGRNDGIVNRRQLLAAGVSPNQVDSRVKNRSLKMLYAGVYAVGHDCLSLQGRQRAAVMAGGPNAVLSHRAAASLLGLLPPDGKLEVIRKSSPDPHRPPPEHASRAINPGLTIHRTRSLSPTEVTTRRGIRVTSAVRTMINLAERESSKTLDTAVRRGVANRSLDLAGLNRAINLARGRKGIAKLRKVVENWNPGKLRSKSGLENRTADRFPEWGIPMPLINDFRCGYEIDFQWPGSNILVEADGGAYHASRADRHRDYQRTLDLQAAGNTVVRIDEAMVGPEAFEVGMKIRKLLEDEGVVELQPLSPQPVAVSDRAPP